LECSVAGRAGGALRASRAHLDFVKERRVANAKTRSGRTRSIVWSKVAGVTPVEPTAHLAVPLEPKVRCECASEGPPGRAEEWPLRSLPCADTVGIGAEIAKALQQILFPRQEDHGDVAQRNVALQRSAKSKAVESRHENIAESPDRG